MGALGAKRFKKVICSHSASMGDLFKTNGVGFGVDKTISSLGEAVLKVETDVLNTVIYGALISNVNL